MVKLLMQIVCKFIKRFKDLTARPTKDEQKNIKHHMYGFVDLNKNFSTGQWLKTAIKKLKKLKKEKKYLF